MCNISTAAATWATAGLVFGAAWRGGPSRRTRAAGACRRRRSARAISRATTASAGSSSVSSVGLRRRGTGRAPPRPGLGSGLERHRTPSSTPRSAGHRPKPIERRRAPTCPSSPCSQPSGVTAPATATAAIWRDRPRAERLRLAGEPARRAPTSRPTRRRRPRPGSGVGSPSISADHHRADLVLDHAVVHHRPVGEVGDRPCPCCGPRAPSSSRSRRVTAAAQRLAGLRVPAAGVRPGARPGRPWPPPDG